MTADSSKWDIYEISPGIVRVEFYDPAGTRVLTAVTFDTPAVKEFADALNEVAQAL